MIEPKLDRVVLDVSEIEQAIHRLTTNYTLPDGTEVVDQHAYDKCYKQLTNGYYYRLVWPANVTERQIDEWLNRARKIVKLHKLGLI